MTTRLRFPRAVAGASRAPLRRQRDGRGALDIPQTWCIFMDTRTKRGKENHMALRLIENSKNRYICTRTSVCDDTEKPCPEAFRVDAVYVDERTVDDPKKIPAHNGTDGGWYYEGSNHRVDKGHIKRDMEQSMAWAVDVDDITAFVDKHGPCIVDRNSEGCLTIGIYDD